MVETGGGDRGHGISIVCCAGARSASGDRAARPGDDDADRIVSVRLPIRDRGVTVRDVTS
jgi:hypothetical protein